MENKTNKKPKSTKYWLDIAGNVASIGTFAILTTLTVVGLKKTYDMGLWGKKETPKKEEESKDNNDGFETVK